MTGGPPTDLLDELVHQFSDPFAFCRELIQNSIDSGSTRIEVVLAYQTARKAGLATAAISDWGERMNRKLNEDYLLTKFRSSKEHDLTKIGKFGIGFVSVFACEPDAVVVELHREHTLLETFASEHPVGAVARIKSDTLTPNATWTADLLFSALAAHLSGLDEASRAVARAAALVYLYAQVMHAVADQVLRTGWISIFEKSWRRRDTRVELVLRADTLREPWIAALEELFGSSGVERVKDVEQGASSSLRATRRRALRRAKGSSACAKRCGLRAGALGHVTPDELDDFCVKSERASAPITVREPE